MNHPLRLRHESATSAPPAPSKPAQAPPGRRPCGSAVHDGKARRDQTCSQYGDYWDNAYFDGSYNHNGRIEPAKGYCTDVFFAQAKSYIRSQADKKQPFFIYLCTNAPHGPNHSPEKFAAPYAKYAAALAHFFGMIANIDDNVGQLRRMLAEIDIADDTIFIFTTDNGTAAGSRIHDAGMRAAKGSEYDGGHRVPFFLHWPAKGWTIGRDVERLTAHVDLLPTFIDLLGLPAPKNVKFDGTSILPLLEGKADGWAGPRADHGLAAHPHASEMA
jgi:arylsulfatase A-like enzyme